MTTYELREFIIKLEFLGSVGYCMRIDNKRKIVMTTPFISVIIPVYNAEPFLSRCMESIQAQNYLNMEIICINDGSTDNSLELLKKFSSQDKRIRVLTQENQGQSAARNRGMQEAKGEYISFIDADDYIKNGLYDYFAENAAKVEPDVFMFNGDIIQENETTSFFQQSMFSDNVKENDVFDYRQITNYFYGNQSICNKIYRRDFLLANHLKMIEGKVFEDTYFNFMTLVKAQKIQYTLQSFYVYCNNNPSSTTKTFSENAFGLFDVFEQMEQEIKKMDLWTYFRYAIFQLEFEKLIETLGMTAAQYQKKFFELSQKLLTRKLFLLNNKICLKLKDFHLCHYLLNYNFNQFRDLVLLEQEKNKGGVSVNPIPMFSIVVPIYNVAPYLPRCIKSLQQQTLGDYEVICVNDGSTDGSGAIADEYAAKDKRIKVLHQANMGLGAARNNGAAEAKGKYLIFLDSDDWLSVNALEKMKETIENYNSPDVGLFGFERYVLEQGAFVVDKNIELFPEDKIFNFHDISDTMYLHPCAWNKFYRREYFQKNNFKFPTKVVFEDLLVHTQVLVQAQSITVCKSDLYYYTIREGSIMNSVVGDKKIHDLKIAVKNTLSYLKEHQVYNELKYSFGVFVKNAFNMHLSKMSEQQRDMFLQSIKEDSEITELLQGAI